MVDVRQALCGHLLGRVGGVEVQVDEPQLAGLEELEQVGGVGSGNHHVGQLFADGLFRTARHAGGVDVHADVEHLGVGLGAASQKGPFAAAQVKAHFARFRKEALLPAPFEILGLVNDRGRPLLKLGVEVGGFACTRHGETYRPVPSQMTLNTLSARGRNSAIICSHSASMPRAQSASVPRVFAYTLMLAV